MSVAAQTSQATSSPKLKTLMSLKGSFLGGQKSPDPSNSVDPLADLSLDVNQAAVPVSVVPDTVPSVQPAQVTQPTQVTPPDLQPEPQAQEQPQAQDQPQQPQQDLTSVAQALPLAIDEMTDTLNPTTPISGGGTVKEAREPGITLERPAADQVPGVQYVEEEKHHENAEIPPEVESYIMQVENHQEQVPEEIVIGDQQAIHPSTKYLAQPVIVLPITPEEEKKGASKGSQFSIRWLVEWSRKVMKMFSGRVVYKQAP
jgi:hypothetical protein